LNHFTNMYGDEPDVLITPDYVITIGDSFIRLGQELVGMCCPPCSTVSFSLNAEVRQCITLGTFWASAYGLSEMEYKTGRHTLTIKFLEGHDTEHLLQEPIIQLVDGLIKPLRSRAWAHALP
jgi:hypothetical protein